MGVHSPRSEDMPAHSELAEFCMCRKALLMFTLQLSDLAPPATEASNVISFPNSSLSAGGCIPLN